MVRPRARPERPHPAGKSARAGDGGMPMPGMEAGPQGAHTPGLAEVVVPGVVQQRIGVVPF